mmetsp:Transcript_8881/g.21327  ORF Transcript_8881/g.21327 Transcript_8881/m.21327 type:complete len:215 (-) Transcript_8881:317-961(-)
MRERNIRGWRVRRRLRQRRGGRRGCWLAARVHSGRLIRREGMIRKGIRLERARAEHGREFVQVAAQWHPPLLLRLRLLLRLQLRRLLLRSRLCLLRLRGRERRLLLLRGCLLLQLRRRLRSRARPRDVHRVGRDPLPPPSVLLARSGGGGCDVATPQRLAPAHHHLQIGSDVPRAAATSRECAETRRGERRHLGGTREGVGARLREAPDPEQTD